MVFFCRLRYWDLGRNKANGQKDIFGKTEEDMNTQIFKEFSKHLVSSDITFTNGTVYAGFHMVGKYMIEAKNIIGDKDGKITGK